MKKKVLVVDDSGTVRQQVSIALQQAGFDTMEAADGREGFNTIGRNQDISLVVCDVNMPNMNGLDFVKELTSTLENPPPIVMITTEGSEEIVDEAMARGANGYLKKPFTPEKIQEVLGPLLQ